jgi:predicted nucleic acid-binding protein
VANDPVLVDSNVILDISTEDPAWFEWSSAALAAATETARLVINPIVYAEVSIRFLRIEDLDAALPRDRFVREPIPFAAAFMAGKVFQTYRRRGGGHLSPLPDFFCWRSCCRGRLPAADPRSEGSSHLFPQGPIDCTQARSRADSMINLRPKAGHRRRQNGPGARTPE